MQLPCNCHAGAVHSTKLPQQRAPSAESLVDGIHFNAPRHSALASAAVGSAAHKCYFTLELIMHVSTYLTSICPFILPSLSLAKPTGTSSCQRSRPPIEYLDISPTTPVADACDDTLLNSCGTSGSSPCSVCRHLTSPSAVPPQAKPAAAAAKKSPSEEYPEFGLTMPADAAAAAADAGDPMSAFVTLPLDTRSTAFRYE